MLVSMKSPAIYALKTPDFIEAEAQGMLDAAPNSSSPPPPHPPMISSHPAPPGSFYATGQEAMAHAQNVRCNYAQGCTTFLCNRPLDPVTVPCATFPWTQSRCPAQPSPGPSHGALLNLDRQEAGMLEAAPSARPFYGSPICDAFAALSVLCLGRWSLSNSSHTCRVKPLAEITSISLLQPPHTKLTQCVFLAVSI
jgi:hypothetical protein